jgi:hypothetical protein
LPEHAAFDFVELDHRRPVRRRNDCFRHPESRGHTMAFLGFGIRAPLALVVAGFYALGAITGGSLFALLRRSFEASRPPRP